MNIRLLYTLMFAHKIFGKGKSPDLQFWIVDLPVIHLWLEYLKNIKVYLFIQQKSTWFYQNLKKSSFKKPFYRECKWKSNQNGQGLSHLKIILNHCQFPLGRLWHQPQ